MCASRIENKGVGLLVPIIDAPVENNPVKNCVESNTTDWEIQTKVSDLKPGNRCITRETSKSSLMSELY